MNKQKKDVGHYGESTMYVVRIGGVLRKQYYFPEQNVPEFRVRIRSLADKRCIGYMYSHIEYDSRMRTLDTERPYIVGTALDSLDEYSDQLIAEWDLYTDRLLEAGDLFDTLGRGHVPTEPKELHNYILDQDRVIQAIDIEASFVVVHDRKLYDEYVANIRESMRLELRRYALLRRIETAGR